MLIIFLIFILITIYYFGLALKAFKLSFIGLWAIVGLCNLYKSTSYDSLRKDNAKIWTISYWKSWFSSLTSYTILSCIIVYIFKIFINEILKTDPSEQSLLYIYLVLFGVFVCCRYIMSFLKELKKTGNRDFSLTSSNMRKAITLNSIIILSLFFVWMFILPSINF